MNDRDTLGGNSGDKGSNRGNDGELHDVMIKEGLKCVFKRNER